MISSPSPSLPVLLLGFLAAATMMTTTTTVTTVTAQVVQGQGQGRGQGQGQQQQPAMFQQEQQPQQQAQSIAQFEACGGEFNPTLAGIICGQDFDFVYGTLCAALQAPGNEYLFDTLNAPDATSTLWAPDNGAFENLNQVFATVNGVDGTTSQTYQDFLFSQEGQPMLTNVLLYHVAEGFLPSDALLCGEPISTLLGTSTTQCQSATGPIFQVRD